MRGREEALEDDGEEAAPLELCPPQPVPVEIHVTSPDAPSSAGSCSVSVRSSTGPPPSPSSSLAVGERPRPSSWSPAHLTSSASDDVDAFGQRDKRHRRSDPGPAPGVSRLRLSLRPEEGRPASAANTATHGGGATVVAIGSSSSATTSPSSPSPSVHRLRVPAAPTTSILITDSTDPSPVTSAPPSSGSNRVTISVGAPASGSPRIDGGHQVVIPISPARTMYGASTVLVLEGGADDSAVSNVRVEPDPAAAAALLRDPVAAVRCHLVPHVCGRRTPSPASPTPATPSGSEDDAPASAAVRRLSSLLEHSDSPTDCVDDLDPEPLREQDYVVLRKLLAPEPRVEEEDEDDEEEDDVEEEEKEEGCPRFVIVTTSDASPVEVRDEEALYESIKDPIYEEIPGCSGGDEGDDEDEDDASEKRASRSIFEGASKYDILSYLAGARERGLATTGSAAGDANEDEDFAGDADGEEEDDQLLAEEEEDDDESPPPLPTSPPPAQDDAAVAAKVMLVEVEVSSATENEERSTIAEETLTGGAPAEDESLGDLSSRASHLSHSSESSEDSAGGLLVGKARKSSAEIERNDSGVGSETSKSSRSRWRQHQAPTAAAPTTAPPDAQLLCEDCEQRVEPQVTDSGLMFAPLVCRKCAKRRAERREIIAEIVETEEKYARDLRIVLDEFRRPMEVAGLLSCDQLSGVFLNVEDLLENARTLAERLRDSLDIALDQGDEDLLTVDVGRLFLDAAPMLHAFESYCTRQGAASLLLAQLEKEKELLRIFLRVSQMENAVLRRMNLNSFLMVPVQRVTKYPLLLARLYKVTPAHLPGRELLKQAQHKIELHLEHMNSEAKDVTTTKLWRRISIINLRRHSGETDMLVIKLRKMALDLLDWSHEETHFSMEGKLFYTNPTDGNWRRSRTVKLNPVSALLVTKGKPMEDLALDPPEEPLMFARRNGNSGGGVREAQLLLVKEKGGRYSLLRDPLALDKCIVCCDTAEGEEFFELQELTSKETYIFRGEDCERTRAWYRMLQFQSQGLGAWRRRRNALANIMINGMQTRS